MDFVFWIALGVSISSIFYMAQQKIASRVLQNLTISTASIVCPLLAVEITKNEWIFGIGLPLGFCLSVLFGIIGLGIAYQVPGAMGAEENESANRLTVKFWVVSIVIVVAFHLPLVCALFSSILTGGANCVMFF
ncbi:MAG: hypothetical protein IPG59_09695 [Candidatus Melainabacteria bacterium]|nr:MAG: hypothetical protein IPG59_09695 [Candidatus Melainabacteria bacterium]